MAVLDGKGVASKVQVPAQAGVLIAAVLSILAGFGVEIPLEEDQILETVAAAVLVWTTISGLIGYYTKERNPSQSTIDTIEATNRVLDVAANDPTIRVPVPKRGTPMPDDAAVASAMAAMTDPGLRTRLLPPDDDDASEHGD